MHPPYGTLFLLDLNHRLTATSLIGSLDSYINLGHCKHAIIGVCHDSGYAPYLRKYATAISTRDRITLLEGGPIHPRIAALGFQRTLKMDTVFAPQKGDSTSSHRPKKSRTVLRLAAVDSSDRLPRIMRDETGKRVDKPIDVDVKSNPVKALKEANLCFWYHLRGKCEAEACSRIHTKSKYRLTDESFEILWLLARSQKCRKFKKGKDCADRLCIRRHGKS